MDVKEAIEWLEWARRQKFIMYHGEVGSEPFENIINLLKRGEKYEAIIKRKHFPKPVTKEEDE